jgi:predicted PurR-regulated permease PerM
MKNLHEVASARMHRNVRVPWATLVKILAAVVAGWAIVRLWPSVQLFLISVLLAVALSPIVGGLERRGVGHGIAVSLLALAIVLILAAFCFFVLPPLMEQVSDLWKNLPHFRNVVAKHLEGGGLPSRIILPLLDLPRSPEFDARLAKPLIWGPKALEVLAGLLIAVVLSLYLLFDGRKVVAWLLAYVPRAHRRRMRNMVPEVFDVVQAFTTGQMLISALFSVFTFIVLTALDVPAALPLALFAGLCDVIPVAGISVATVAASLCALTVSPSVALMVFSIYVCYHLFEAYILVPRLYGNRLKLSTLTVLLAILAGGTLGGVIGAVLALPIVAAYPVIEKHWLDDYLHPDALEDHRALRDTDGKASEAVVDAVLQGAAPRK